MKDRPIPLIRQPISAIAPQARYLIRVPDALRGNPVEVERFLKLVSKVPFGRSVELDLSEVSFVCPYGIVMLLGVCHLLADQSKTTVLLQGIRQRIHAYLRRANFFEQAGNTVTCVDDFDEMEDLARSSASSTMLEVAPIKDDDDVYLVKERARTILSRGLDLTEDDVDHIVSLVAESCGNIVAHSEDNGIVTIQKYGSGAVNIELAISDLGIGIPESLMRTYGSKLANTDAEYIERALGGLSSRPGSLGGLGLIAIGRIVTQSGGKFYVRSRSASVMAQGSSYVRQEDLFSFPGTQLALAFGKVQW